MHLKDAEALGQTRQRYLNLSVEASGAQKRLVQCVQTVGRGHDHHAVALAKAAHLGQKGVKGLLTLVAAVVTLFADGVDLIKEYDRASGLARRLEQCAHTACAHAHVHLHKVRTVDREKRYACLARQGPRHERLACAGCTIEHHAMRHPRSETAVGFGRTNKMQHVTQAFHGLVVGGHIRKSGAGRR